MDTKTKILIFAVFLSVIGLVLPGTDEQPLSFINATSINSTGLTPNSGNNTILISEMNAGYWEGNETNSNPWEIIITYHNVTSFDAIDFSSRYFSSTGTPSSHEVELMVYCTIHSDYMEFKDYHNEPDWYSRTYFVSNSNHYIMPNGTVFLKLRHPSNGINTHVIRIDVARLIVQPKFRADTNIFNNYTNITGSSGTGNASNSGGVSVFLPDKIINSSGSDIGNLYTMCLDINVHCYVGVTNYPNASIGDNFQSHFTTPINFSNLTIYSLDDTSRGIADLYINEVLVSSNIDFYKPNVTNITKTKIDLGGTYPPGYYNITLVVTGKNASSLGYTLHVSQMILWMEGADNYNQSFDGVSDINNYSFNQTFINTSCSGCVNETQLNYKVNKSGDTMTGSINYTITTGSLGIYTYVGNSSISNCVSGNIVADFPGFFPTGIWSVARCNLNNTWELGKNGSQRGYAMGFVPDTITGGYTGRGFRVQTFLPNQTSYTDFFQTKEDVTRIIKGNLTIEESGKDLTVANLSGTGYRPLCADPNGMIVVCP